MLSLAALFFLTALLYSAVGFGGGSTYNALLVLVGADFRIIPIIALGCNIIVVIIGSWRFARSGQVPWRRIWPMFVLSVPMAWLGGRLMIGELLFVGLLAVSLFVAGLLMLWQPYWEKEAVVLTRSRLLEPAAGGVLGFLAGVVGIGGGIFLAPLLYILRWGKPREIAGTSAVFILVNSISGLAGQLGKSHSNAEFTVAASYWPIFPAVLVGGLLGSSLGSRRLDPKYVRILTALLILYVAIRLAIRFYGEVSGVAG